MKDSKKENRAIFLLKAPYFQIADTFRTTHGWETYGYSAQKLNDHLTRGMSESLDLFEIIESTKSSPIPYDILDQCSVIEDEYNCNLADLIAIDRHMGSGWITGGLYPKSRMSTLPYEKHLQLIVTVLRAQDEFLRRVQPKFVSPGVPGSFQIATMFLACEKNNIPVYSVTEGRYGVYYYWQTDRTALVPGLPELYQQMKDDPELKLTGNRSVYLPRALSSIKNHKAKGSLKALVKKMAKIFYQLIRSRGRSIGSGQLYLSGRIAYMLQNYRDFKKEMKRPYRQLSEVGHYIYFPLHFEPEASLNGREPYFSNQMYAIEMLSKSVPAGVTVLVKEHWAGVGNRPSYWMDKVAGFPRVEIADPFADSIEIISKCLATATITGTAGFEAAVMGKPVISLGSNYRFNFVDHVWFQNDIPGLRVRLKWIFENREHLDFSEDGHILQQAFERSCFKVNGQILNTKKASQEAVEVACEDLLGRLKIINDVISNSNVVVT